MGYLMLSSTINYLLILIYLLLTLGYNIYIFSVTIMKQRQEKSESPFSSDDFIKEIWTLGYEIQRSKNSDWTDKYKIMKDKKLVFSINYAEREKWNDYNFLKMHLWRSSKIANWLAEYMWRSIWAHIDDYELMPVKEKILCYLKNSN